MKGFLGNTKFLLIVVVVLITIAAILGYAIVKDTSVFDTIRTGRPQSSATPSSTSAPNAVASNRPDYEKRALEVPDGNASQEDIVAYMDLVSQLATPSENLVITNCDPNPFVLKATPDQTITVRNDSDQEATVSFDPQHQYSVPSNGQVSISINGLGRGEGVYGYSCNGSQSAVGLFFVTR